MASIPSFTMIDVTQNAPSKIHVVTRAYLASWALRPGRVLRPVSLEFGDQKPKAPAAVGWVRNWWGESDPALNEACEKACAPLEGLVPKILRNVEQQWPFSDDNERGILAQFIALHIVRTEGTRAWFAIAREESLRSMHDDWDLSVPFDEFAAVARSDKERARKLLAMINKLASTLGSMHWTLLRFDKPLIITSDHPVCPAPLLDDGQPRDLGPAPAEGWGDIVEFRFPLTPRLVLIGSWFLGDDFDKPVEGDWNHAANINGVLRAQADRQWFRVHPGPTPPFPPLIYRDVSTTFEPITPRLLPNYDSIVARHSLRRLGVVEEVGKLIERQNDDMMFIARPDLRPRVA